MGKQFNLLTHLFRYGMDAFFLSIGAFIVNWY